MSVDTDSPPTRARRRPRGRASLRTTADPPTSPDAVRTPGPPTTPVPPRLPGRRDPRWIAFGVLALCLGGLLSYAVYSRVSTETTVLALSGTVYRGEVLEAANLTSVTVHGQLPGPAVPVGAEATVIGKRAVFDLPQGSLLDANSVASAAVPQVGSALVGLRLATGRAPASLLLPSSPVRVVALPPAAAADGTKDPLSGKTFAGRIVDQRPGVDGTSVVVDLEVAAEQAPTVALLAAQERVALVRDAGR